MDVEQPSNLQQLPLSSVPPNLKFIVDDAEDTWLYQDKFDLIHARLMSGSFQDWPKFFRQAYQWVVPALYLLWSSWKLNYLIATLNLVDGLNYKTTVYQFAPQMALT
jgi:hypothetical protein